MGNERAAARPHANAPEPGERNLRLVSPAQSPAPGHATVPRPRPPIRLVTTPSSDPVARPGGIAWWLWVLLAGSLAFFAAARVYVRHQEAKMAGAVETVPLLQTNGPDRAVAAGALDLAWDDVAGATVYRLSIASVTGQIVVEKLPVDGTEWIPPDGALPALVRGEYRWSVEALDEKEAVLAKSAESTFRVL